MSVVAGRRSRWPSCLGGVANHDASLVRGFFSLFMLFSSVFFEMMKREIYLEVIIRPSRPILVFVVSLALAEGVWSHVPDGFLWIR
jgi:hypothetical protein